MRKVKIIFIFIISCLLLFVACGHSVPHYTASQIRAGVSPVDGPPKAVSRTPAAILFPPPTTTIKQYVKQGVKKYTTKTKVSHGCRARSLDQISRDENPGRNPAAVNGSSGAGGDYQILPSTWQSNGGTNYAPTADQATPEQQRVVAEKLYREQGAKPWDASC